MANRKISQFTTTTDITTVQGLAGYNATTNVQISGSALITSLEANLYKPFGNNGDVLTLVNGVPTWAAGGSGGNATMADVYVNSVAVTPNTIAATDNTADLQLTNNEITFTAGGKGKFESDSALTLESIGDEAILKGDAGVKVFSGTGVTLESDSGNNQYSFAFDVNGGIQLDGVNGNVNEVMLSNGVGNQVEWGKVQLTAGSNPSVTGVLGVANGGTGIGSLTAGNILVGDGTNAVQSIDAKGKGKLVVGETSLAFGQQTTVLPVGADGTVLTADSSLDVGVKWATPTSGGPSAFTTLTAADVVDWDYATDGPNIKLTLGSGLENVLTVDNINDFPSGSTGFVILNPASSTDYKMPDEDYGSATGIKSLMSGGNASLGGTNDVVWEWTYDGANFWWQKFENYVEPIYPPSIQFDQTDLLAYYTPKAYPQAVQGNVVSGTIVENLTSSNTIGDLQTSANVTNFEFYPETATDPAYWSMAGSQNAILKGNPISSAVSTEATFSGWMQGPYVSKTYGGVFDFFGTQSGADFDQQVYLSGREFILFSPSTTPAIQWPELVNYPGGADLSNEWIFMSFSFTPATTSTSSDGQLKAALGCKSSYDWAQANPPAPGGTTNWEYDPLGTGNTIPVDENGLYFYTSNPTLDLDEFFFNNFYLGNAADLTNENNPAHYGEFGIFGAVIPDSQVIANWNGSRETYGIT